MSAGASLRPSVRERCARACEARLSAEALRVVGTGGSLAVENCGATVLCGVADDVDEVVVEGFAVLDVVVVFVAVDEVVAAAALGVVVDHAGRIRVVDRPRCAVRGAPMVHPGCADEIRTEMPLRTGVVAMIAMYSGGAA